MNLDAYPVAMEKEKNERGREREREEEKERTVERAGPSELSCGIFNAD